MTESQFQSRLLRALRIHPALRDAEVWKVSDRFSAGRPDVQIIYEGKTTYFELKVAPYRPTKLQAYYLKRLAPRAHVVTLLKNGLIQLDKMATHWEFSMAVEFIVQGATL